MLKIKGQALSEGQIIVMATDGVWEAENIDGEIFGKDRIYDLIRANAALSAKGILNILMDMLYRFTKGKKFGDDVTLVVIKIGKNAACIILSLLLQTPFELPASHPVRHPGSHPWKCLFPHPPFLGQAFSLRQVRGFYLLNFGFLSVIVLFFCAVKIGR
jgi:hypothetical protein